ncbi:DegT/DnrJ/EryC1/StrS family aminotransferase [Halanaerobium congolense]|jgi:hypothetical protein|uniref:dTDP-4-amino-4,6-dideoxygalactose transaminase n=1 Tax=Halanaerobium congolense TaxID=54121 RepID=A0A1G6QGX2_9FIRM|nr:DegT/DnrJ/EryC1/StrS family aminotransferase [Halanaerobium congolense]SDC91174.1 hypothetical protein SAMN04488597_1188 [Halanaerobium congolense]
MDKKIFVTKPFLPPLDEYNDYLEQIWESGILTHNGPMVQELEKNLKEKMNIDYISCLSNGTMALQLAIKALDLEGEIITTPFTFVATTSSIIWEKCTPVFVDINKETFNIDEEKIEEKITDKTVAILGVHVFSNPCNIEKIDEIAKRYNLKVIYDAAHSAFVNYKGKPLVEAGDISATSFHATKLFNTIEGGACVTNDKEIDEKIKELRFFGFNSNKEIIREGTNAKMNEIQAAMGLSVLKYIDIILQTRQEKYKRYVKRLSNINWITFQKIDNESYNYSYMPVVFDTEERLLRVLEKLNNNNVFPRRYFYPSLDQVEVLNNDISNCKNSKELAKKILCLPLYHDLKNMEINKICELIGTLA